MAENVLVLKRKAVAKGMDKKTAMKASRAELEEFLSGGGKSDKKKSVAKKKSSEKKTTKKTTAKKSAKKSSEKKSTKKTNSKKSSSKKSQPKGGGDGRHMIGSLDFTDTDGWNPREGSPVALIFKALKKRKGDVDKTTDDLLPDAKDYVSTKKKDGTKRTKDEIRNLLRYRVNRTKWEFAKRTGQHEPSENRVEYGTGDYAQNSKKSKPKSSAKKSAKKPAPKKGAAKKSGKKSTKKSTKKKK